MVRRKCTTKNAVPTVHFTLFGRLWSGHRYVNRIEWFVDAGCEHKGALDPACKGRHKWLSCMCKYEGQHVFVYTEELLVSLVNAEIGG